MDLITDESFENAPVPPAENSIRVGVETAVGPLAATLIDGGVESIDWARAPRPGRGVGAEVCGELEAYFAGRLTRFEAPLRPGRTEFERRFRAAMLAIPYGRTVTYGEIAEEVGISPQAAGQACGANRIPVIVPCHRVVAASGLGGYSGAGGVEAKVALLRLEGAAGLLI